MTAPTSGSSTDTIIRARRAVIGGQETAADIGLTAGRITSIAPFDGPADGSPVVEIGNDAVLLPGLVDSHVHVNEPGRTEWEGFITATRAAAAGGVTTIIDMPLNCLPPTVDADALAIKRKAAAGECTIDVGFWGGAIPGNAPSLRGLHDAGVFGFKCFLAPSGVDEFPPLDRAGLHQAMTEIQSFGGLLIVHAEDGSVLDSAPAAHGRAYSDFLASRPRRAEESAIGELLDEARETGCRVHILHLSDADALPAIAAARAEGLPVTVETCPHYLVFASESVPDGATLFKCCPPIRETDNRDRLWAGLTGGQIDIVVSDHSPSTAELKSQDSGDFGTAWGGISSLQLGLSAIWTEAAQRGLSLPDVIGWMSAGPARVVGLEHKGGIAVGMDADFCVFAPDETFDVDPAALHHRNAITPYAGRTLRGVVRQTWLRGQPVDIGGDRRGEFIDRPGASTAH